MYVSFSSFQRNKRYKKWLIISFVQQYVSLAHELDKVIVFEKGGLLWVFNFHPTQSYTNYRVGVQTPGKYVTVIFRNFFSNFNHSDIERALLRLSFFFKKWYLLLHRYKIALDTDWKEFHGYERNKRDTEFFTVPEPWNNRAHSIYVWIGSYREMDHNVEFIDLCWLTTKIEFFVLLVVFAVQNCISLYVCWLNQTKQTTTTCSFWTSSFNAKRWYHNYDESSKRDLWTSTKNRKYRTKLKNDRSDVKTSFEIRKRNIISFN